MKIIKHPFVAALATLMLALTTQAETVIFNHSDKAREYFRVPGHEDATRALNQMYFQHKVFFERFGTLWDQWLHRSTLWADDHFTPEVAEMLSSDPAMPHTQMVAGRFMSVDDLRPAVRQLLLTRVMDEEGYVSTMQHRGMGHPLGWPFPLYGQVGGVGWIFSFTQFVYWEGHPLTQNLDGWHTEGIEARWNEQRGIHLKLQPNAVLTAPAFQVRGKGSPFLRMDWWSLSGMENAQPYLEWTTRDHPEFSAERRLYFDPAATNPEMDFAQQTYTVVPLWRRIVQDDQITGFRVGFGNPEPAEICLQAFMTAADTRHNVNNAAWIRGASDYFRWTGDVEFLREIMPRLRQAMEYALTEFRVRQLGVVRTPWFGHEGTSGVVFVDGRKVIRPGYGVGSNYWDLLPFSGYDALATAYMVDALKLMIDLESGVQSNPQWGIESGFEPRDLRNILAHVQARSGDFFWNRETGRFAAARDLDGYLHDYGLTFVNLEAIYYGLANEQQARSIMSWINGDRYVVDDTSHAEDIYRWRFGPRATTRRNIDYYFCGWVGADSIPWGDQIQDGGAVLGFSYFDIMARLKVLGPDNAWQRLQGVTNWFNDVMAIGGYTAYYQQPNVGTLQGGIHGVGGQGLDTEFSESVLMPQVMLYGFMGFQPHFNGFALKPQLPTAWPELEIAGINYQGVVLDITASPAALKLVCRGGERTLEVELPHGQWALVVDGNEQGSLDISATNPTAEIHFQKDHTIELKKL